MSNDSKKIKEAMDAFNALPKEELLKFIMENVPGMRPYKSKRPQWFGCMHGTYSTPCEDCNDRQGITDNWLRRIDEVYEEGYAAGVKQKSK